MKYLAALSVLAAPAAAHLSIWHPSMYGFQAGESWAWEAIKPLARLNFNDWWFHGDIDKPPADGEFFQLPAGGVAHAQVGCQKGVTTYGGRENQHLACDEWGPIHLANSDDQSDVKGCAIAIAYESNVHAIKPEDFVVISTNRSCPYTRDVTFEIPEELPECPPGGCHCMWGWVHSAMGGGEEIYFNGMRCQVTGARPGAKPLPRAQPPTKCANGGCTRGAKQPIYWIQNEGNNIHNPAHDPPFYNEEYGYLNGAQRDIWDGSAASNGGSGSNSGSNSGNSGSSGSNSGNSGSNWGSGSGNSGSNSGSGSGSNWGGDGGDDNGGSSPSSTSSENSSPSSSNGHSAEEDRPWWENKDDNNSNSDDGYNWWGNHGGHDGNKGDKGGNRGGKGGKGGKGDKDGNRWQGGNDNGGEWWKTRDRTRTRTSTSDSIQTPSASSTPGGPDDWHNLVVQPTPTESSTEPSSTSSPSADSASTPSPTTTTAGPDPSTQEGGSAACRARRRDGQVRVRRLRRHA